MKAVTDTHQYTISSEKSYSQFPKLLVLVRGQSGEDIPSFGGHIPEGQLALDNAQRGTSMNLTFIPILRRLRRVRKIVDIF